MDTQFIRAEDLKGKMESREKMIVIDTLPNSLFLQRHIPGAKNACVFEVSFLKQVQAIGADTGDEVVLYGSSDRSYDALTASEKLQRAGYMHIAVLRGGIEEWLAGGHEIEGSVDRQIGDQETLLALEDGHYVLDCSRSSVEWTGRNQNNKHFGTLRFSGGDLSVQGKGLQGELVVDMTSMENISLADDALQPILISHLKSDDFFFVREFPAAKLHIVRGSVAASPYLTVKNCDIESELTLRGVEKDLTFQSTITMPERGELRMEAHFDVDRTRWGVIYGSARFFEHLGMHTVFDDISIGLRLFFQAVP